jgi:hypothetical protein
MQALSHPLDSTQLHPYEALPYAWGDATIRANITCNEKPVLVALNLFDAFKSLRVLYEPQFVWVDAICIDQRNALEKTCQILLMVKIYSPARSVVFWVGDCHLVQAKEALMSVKLIANQLSRVKEETEFKDIRWKDYHVLRITSEYSCASTRDLLLQLYAR